MSHDTCVALFDYFFPTNEKLEQTFFGVSQQDVEWEVAELPLRNNMS